MGRVERTRELARKRTRRAKLAKLRKKYAATRNESDKAEILAKAQKVSPFVSFDEDAK